CQQSRHSDHYVLISACNTRHLTSPGGWPPTDTAQVGEGGRSVLAVLAPVTGVAVGLSRVPDPMFAQGLVGPGTAIDPRKEVQEAVAPITGRIVSFHPHAFVVQSADGKGVLVHLGMNTVR